MAKARAAKPEEPDAWARPAYQARSREQRERLLKAGERVFAEKGFWQAHVADIAARAGCSVGSFYRRFHDKEVFFYALQADMAERSQANIARFFQDPVRQTEPLDEVFRKLVRNTARVMRKIEGYYRALMELSLRGAEVWPQMRLLEGIEADFVVALLEARGVALDEDARTRASLAIRMIHGQIISNILHGPGPFEADDPRLHDQLALVLSRYLGLDLRPA